MRKNQKSPPDNRGSPPKQIARPAIFTRRFVNMYGSLISNAAHIMSDQERKEICDTLRKIVAVIEEQDRK